MQSRPRLIIVFSHGDLGAGFFLVRSLHASYSGEVVFMSRFNNFFQQIPYYLMTQSCNSNLLALPH